MNILNILASHWRIMDSLQGTQYLFLLIILAERMVKMCTLSQNVCGGRIVVDFLQILIYSRHHGLKVDWAQVSTAIIAIGLHFVILTGQYKMQGWPADKQATVKKVTNCCLCLQNCAIKAQCHVFISFYADSGKAIATTLHRAVHSIYIVCVCSISLTGRSVGIIWNWNRERVWMWEWVKWIFECYARAKVSLFLESPCGRVATLFWWNVVLQSPTELYIQRGFNIAEVAAITGVSCIVVTLYWEYHQSTKLASVPIPDRGISVRGCWQA